MDETLPIYSAKEHNVKFDPEEYLNGFYKTAREDEAMQVVLFFLPGIIYRLPSKFETLLDLGAGPTIYVPISMRHRCNEIYVSDYAKVNRDHIISWIKGKGNFDWTEVCKWISNIEASYETPSEMQSIVRNKIQAVLDVDVHKDPTILGIEYVNVGKQQNTMPKEFDVVATIFCLEYASETLEEYQIAVRNASKLVKSGGYMVQGGVLHAKEYGFGGRRFKCHYLTKEEILKSLKKNGMSSDTSNGDEFKMICYDEVFLLVSKKIENK